MKITIPEYLSHLIPIKLNSKHTKFIKDQKKKGITDFVYHIGNGGGIGIGITVVLENIMTHEILDLTDYGSW